MMTDISNRSGLAFDIGSKRIGVARANLGVRFAGPLTTLQDPATFVTDIVGLCRSEDAALAVFGVPRGIEGQETAQTEYTRQFAEQVRSALAADNQAVRLYFMDEALTSVRAKSELAGRAKSTGQFVKSDVDALAATYILEDFLKEHADV